MLYNHSPHSYQLTNHLYLVGFLSYLFWSGLWTLALPPVQPVMNTLGNLSIQGAEHQPVEAGILIRNLVAFCTTVCGRLGGVLWKNNQLCVLCVFSTTLLVVVGTYL